MVVAHSPLHAIGTMRRYTGMEHRTNLAEGQESLGLGFSEPVTGPHAASNGMHLWRLSIPSTLAG